MSDIIIKKVTPVFADGRGEIYDLFDMPLCHGGFVTFTPGASRGNHYHKKSSQYSYVMDGRVELRIKDSRDPDAPVRSFMLEKGDWAEVPPFIIHAFIGLENSTMFEFTTESRADGGYEADNFKVTSL